MLPNETVPTNPTRQTGDMVLRFTADAVKQLRWLLKARYPGDKNDRLNSIFKIGTRLFCADGYRVHSMPLPRTLDDPMLPANIALTPETPAGAVMVVTPNDSRIPKLHDLTPAIENQICAFWVNPKFLSDAVQSNHTKVVVRVFKRTDDKPGLLTIEDDNGAVAYIMPMVGEIKQQVPLLVALPEIKPEEKPNASIAEQSA
jgi:hypothetical protein